MARASHIHINLRELRCFICSGAYKCKNKDCLMGQPRLGKSVTGYCKIFGQYVSDISMPASSIYSAEVK